MKLDINEKAFSLKYAIVYTLMIAIIFLAPFAIYTKYRYTLEEVKTEIALKQKSIQIIQKMELFNPSKEQYFYFPKYKSYNAGLYDKNGNTIFTMIDKNLSILDLKLGYSVLGEQRYYVTHFQDDVYFEATYLVVESTFDIYAVLKNILIAFFLILIAVFLFSLMILKHFATPFKQVHRALDDFIKDAMHEINTPLSVINVNIDMMHAKSGKNKYLSRIKSASKILSGIYNDMNYLIKEQAINNTEKQMIDFTQVLHRSIDYFKDIAELKNIILVTQVEENIEICFVLAKLQKIIDNNLSNAIKYSHEDTKIIITLKKRGEKTILGFRDFGIGIKEPQKIFSRYYREDDTKGGFGIGLDIVGKIVKEEKIDVHIDSKFKKGSYFEYVF